MAEETLRVKIESDLEEFVNGTREAVSQLKKLKAEEAKTSGQIKSAQARLKANQKQIALNNKDLAQNKKLNSQRLKRIANLKASNLELAKENRQLGKNIKSKQQLLATQREETAGAQRNLDGIEKRTAYLENLAKPSLRYALYDVSQTLQRTALALAAFSAVPVGFAIKYEREFANVIRTNELAGDSAREARDALLASLRDIAQATPIPWKDITNIATLAGQLGIASELVADFTETVAKFSATTDLSVDAAATGFGRLNQLIDGVDGQFEELGSAILAVGVDSVATESSIVNVSTNIASMGNLAGLTASDIIGLSGAIASLGIRPELARGNITRLFSNINKSVAVSGYNLEEYGRLTGRTADEFADAWSSDPTDVLLDFFEGIASEGVKAERTLRDLGITSVRDIPAILRLAQSQDEVRRLVQVSNDAFREGAKINEQYSIIAGTTAEEIRRLTQNLATLGATIGESSGTGGPIAIFIKLLNEGLVALTAFAQTDIGKGFSFFLVTISAVLSGFFALGSAIALVTAGLSALIFTSKTVGININAFGLKALFTGRTLKVIAAQAGIAESSLARLGRTARLTGLAFGAIGVALSLVGLAFDASNQAQDRSRSLTDDLIKGNENLRKAIEDDTKAYLEGESVIRTFAKTTDVAKNSMQGSVVEAKHLYTGLREIAASGTSAAEGLDSFVAAGNNVVDSLVAQAAESENFKNILLDQDLRNLFFEGFGDVGGFFETALGDPQAILSQLRTIRTELVASQQSISALDQVNVTSSDQLERVQQLIDLVTGISSGDLFFDDATELAALFAEEMEGVEARTALASGQISQFSKALFGTINAEKKAAQATAEFFAAVEEGTEDVDVASDAFQNFINSIAETGDPQQAMVDLAFAQKTLADQGTLTEDQNEQLKNAIVLLGLAAGYSADEIDSMVIALTNAIGPSQAVANAIANPFDIVTEKVNTASGAVETLSDKFNNLLDDIFDPVSALQDAAESVFDLGAAYAELGDDAFYASDEIQDAVSNILDSSGSAEEGVANLNALYARLAQTVGSDTAPSLAFLRGVIDQVATEFGVAQEAVAGFANIDLGFFTSGLREVSEEVRTLSDYAGDLENVVSRAFDIRFASTFAIDNIAEAWFDLTSQVEDAQYAVEELAATQQDLGSDRALKEYFLSVAEAYDDTLRASQLRKEIADLDRQQAQNARELAEAQQIAGGDLTTQGPGSRQNRTALLGLVQEYQGYITTLAESGASQEELTNATAEARAEFIEQARELGFQESVVLEYAQAFDDVKTAIDRVPRNITVNANTNPAIQALNELNSKLKESINLAGRLNQIQGQPVPAPKNFESSAIPAGTSAKIEVVDTASAVRRFRQLERLSGFSSGGYTGPGAANAPAGIVHRGEYVVPKNMVNQSSGLPNASFLAQLQNGMRGYQMGGFVGGGGMGGDTMMVELSPYDRKLLENAGNVQLRVDGKVVASATNRSNFNQARRGSD